jgi:uncharacterized protein YhaN
MGLDTIPLALRSSKLKANAKEKDALEFLAAAIQNCQKLDQPKRATLHPLIKQLVEDNEAGFKDILTKTYAGDLSWGATISAAEELAANYEKRRQELIAMGEAQQAQQAQQEQQERQRIAAALDAEQARQRAALAADAQRQQYENVRRQQQAEQDIINGLLLMQAARPRPIAPIISPPVSCSSRNLGGTVYTNCQ